MRESEEHQEVDEEQIKEEIRDTLFQPLAKEATPSRICVHTGCNRIATRGSHPIIVCDACSIGRIEAMWILFGKELQEEYIRILRGPGQKTHERQHHIPQMVLKRFALTTESNKMRVLQARRDSDFTPKSVSIKDAAVRSELYTAFSPSTGKRDDLWLEQWFGYIETNYDQLLNCIAADGMKKKGNCIYRGESIGIREVKQRTWLWINSLFYRTPHRRESMNDGIISTRDARGFPDANVDDLYRFLVLTMHDQAANLDVDALAYKVYEFDRTGLIIGDNPVLGIDVPPTNDVFTIRYPLDRRHLLHVSNRGTSGRDRGTQRLMDECNRQVITSCHNTVYFHPDDEGYITTLIPA